MTTANSHDAFCPLTQAWHVNYSITLSNYNHDAYTYLLELKSGWRQLITFENFFDEWRNEETLIGIICLSFILTNFSFTYLYMKNIVHFTSKVLRERSVSLFIAWEGGGGSLDFNLISFVFHFLSVPPVIWNQLIHSMNLHEWAACWMMFWGNFWRFHPWWPLPPSLGKRLVGRIII